jgi:excisionase family DNA binding protein
MNSKTRVVEKPVTSRPTVESPLLDIDTVASILGVTRRHVQRLVAERRIPFLKVGRFIRFDEASLNVWLDQQRCEPQRAEAHEHAPWR